MTSNKTLAQFMVLYSFKCSYISRKQLDLEHDYPDHLSYFEIAIQ